MRGGEKEFFFRPPSGLGREGLLLLPVAIPEDQQMVPVFAVAIVDVATLLLLLLLLLCLLLLLLLLLLLFFVAAILSVIVAATIAVAVAFFVAAIVVVVVGAAAVAVAIRGQGVGRHFSFGRLRLKKIPIFFTKTREFSPFMLLLLMLYRCYCCCCCCCCYLSSQVVSLQVQ